MDRVAYKSLQNVKNENNYFNEKNLAIQAYLEVIQKFMGIFIMIKLCIKFKIFNSIFKTFRSILISIFAWIKQNLLSPSCYKDGIPGRPQKHWQRLYTDSPEAQYSKHEQSSTTIISKHQKVIGHIKKGSNSWVKKSQMFFIFSNIM